MAQKRRRQALPAAVLLVLLSCSGSLLLAKAKKKVKLSPDQPAQMDESKRVAHLLSRLTFGPRPGDLEKVSAMGVEKWFEEQLRPDRIDDAAIEARLAPLRTLKMDARTMVENFPSPQVLRAVEMGRMRMPSDPDKRAIYQSAMEAYKSRQEAKAQAGKANGDMNNDNPEMQKNDMSQDTPEARERRGRRQEDRMYAGLQAQSLIDKAPQDRYNAILKMEPAERRMMLQKLSQEERASIVNGLTPEQREELLALANPQAVVATELAQGKLLRAIYSDRQLQEVMTDFWFNHFNVFIQKGTDRFYTTSYERDAIRKNALGKFKDLLHATAEHPAMLFYLDNFQSIGPNSQAAQFGGRGGNRAAMQGLGNNPRPRPGFGGWQRNRGAVFPNPTLDRNPARNPNSRGTDGNAAAQRPKRGLNENYARELMELHTLGVDGGYTQQDIIEVAKVFTGWTIREPQMGGDFEFNERLHEPGDKTVLGERIKEGGQNEGKQVLELLAKHPSTAKFISRKLAMRFVSDNPPQPLVDRMAATFLAKDGDIKEVLRTMVKSPEFWAPEAYRAKVKTPLEFVVSAARVTGANVDNALPLAQALQRMGMPLYNMQPPTGYSMKADTWVNSGALLNRMNFALGLGAGRIRGVAIDTQAVVNGRPAPVDDQAAVSVIANALLAGDMSRDTRSTIDQQLQDPAITQQVLDDPQRHPVARMGMIAGLILGSPEFQRR